MQNLRASAALGFALIPVPAPAADTPSNGFSLTSLPFPTQNVTATLSTGEIAAFDGVSIDLYAADGALLQHLGSLPAAAFPGVFELDPTESFLLFGESTAGDLYRVALDGSGMTFLANLVFNYDAAFESAGTAVVSAASCGFFCGSELWRLDVQSGALTLLASLTGPSGPLAFGPGGLLYYATQSEDYPAPPGSTDVVFFLPTQLQGGVLLHDADAFPFTAGFDGGGDLELDPSSGALYLAENNFSTGANRVRQVAGTLAGSPVIVEGSPGNTIDRLEFVPGAGPATFQPYQPSSGGLLRYSTTDFAGFADRVAVRPARPQALLLGPGASGPGRVELRVTGAEPGGTLIVAYGPQGTWDPLEATYLLSGAAAPVHTGLVLETLQLVPVVLPVDAGGEGSFAFHNPGTLLGLFALQGIVGDALDPILGTSTGALL